MDECRVVSKKKFINYIYDDKQRKNFERRSKTVVNIGKRLPQRKLADAEMFFHHSHRITDTQQNQ